MKNNLLVQIVAFAGAAPLVAIAFVTSTTLIFVIFDALNESALSHLKQWQTLYAGLVAFAGAIITVTTIRTQTKQANKKFEESVELDKQKRREQQKRSQAALRIECNYYIPVINSYIDDLKEYYRYFIDVKEPDESDLLYARQNIPELKDKLTYKILGELTGILNENSLDRSSVVLLVRRLQLSNARTSSFYKTLENELDPHIGSVKSFEEKVANTPLVDLIIISVLTSMFYEYIRFESNHIVSSNQLSYEFISRLVDNTISNIKHDDKPNTDNKYSVLLNRAFQQNNGFKKDMVHYILHLYDKLSIA